ncbi:protein translocase subunit SecF [Oceanirhabdus seepicola]|uniref:Protein-export membrane protein SecF n=1 Tax=Oceanirhabdus seepicola TaxID=2828781 RepID=A0A9J6PC07_9CLOT|nr:protein translocase subunit SecF [Oceanirhabdus seepicola]MCM1992581.1 protein translocase subunit SecF [Oceanirhabdus seepicola]
MLKIVEKSKIWFSISIAIIAVGLFFMFTNGLNFGIDFKGGTVVKVDFQKEMSQDDKTEIETIISKYCDVDDTEIRVVNKTEVELSFKADAIEKESIGALHKEIKDKFELKDDYVLSESNKGASISKELTRTAWIAVVVATIAMLIYITFRFEFTFGVAAVIALLHDILITLSIYAIFDVKINTPFIAAMLTILGYSINDTIVVFDRVRENKNKNRKLPLNELANNSIRQTISRSINTSISTLITIIILFILVPSIREFTLPLIVGVVSGSYSSIFIASPAWVMISKKFKKAYK